MNDNDAARWANEIVSLANEAIELRKAVQDQQAILKLNTELEDQLTTLRKAIRPLFDSHGPRFGSDEWQAAWSAAAALVKEPTP